MPVQDAFRIHLDDRPGELAKLARQFADAGVNIRAIAGVHSGDSDNIEIIADDVAAASAVLDRSGAGYKKVRVLVSHIPADSYDKPGMLAAVAETLAGAGINIESLYTAIGGGGQIQAVLGCSDPEKAEMLLQQLMAQ